MAETVFILGAGASSEAGAPVMNNFMQTARNLAKSGEIAPGDLNIVSRGIEELQKAQSNAKLNLKNLEDVFGAFEMAKLIGRLGSMNPEEVSQLTDALVELITQTLGHSLRFPIDPDEEHPARMVKPSPPYAAFAKFIYSRNLRYDGTGVRPFSIITFNYDPCIDDALTYNNLPYDYCLGSKFEKAELNLLKLHGSLNWVCCPQCNNKVTYWKVEEQIAKTHYSVDELEDRGSKTVKLMQFLAGHRNFVCGHSGNSKPFIVPPTYSKGNAHSEIASVWAAAASELREAENVFVIGFSLPETDHFFQHFYALGATGNLSLNRFWVYDINPMVAGRFKEILGQNALDAFDFHEMSFSKALTHLDSVLPLK